MGIAWGIVVTLLSLLGWGGQTLAWFAPSTAVDLGLMESEDSVEPAFFADSRGEARWDTLSLWTMVVAGVLLIVDDPAWAYFGLLGGGMYLYFSGRGISARCALRAGGHRIGEPRSVATGLAFLLIWGVMALITIIAAIVALPTS